MADQQAALDFYYAAIGRVAPLAKEIVARYYGRPADHSYYVGLFDRRPRSHDHVATISFDTSTASFPAILPFGPVIRILGLAYFAAALNGVDPKMSDADKKLVVDSIVNTCDEKDGLKDRNDLQCRCVQFQSCGADL
jgi:feruloyl esterase